MWPRSEPPAAAREGVEVSFERLVALRPGAGDGVPWAAPSSRRAGGFAALRPGPGLEIRDVRAFADGDDLRHTDAAATARTGVLHVRSYHEERDKVALLVADFRRPMLWGTHRRLRSVAAAEALAALGWQVVDAGGKVGLLCVRDGDTVVLPPRDRERAMVRVAGGLERAHRAAIAAAGRGPSAATGRGLSAAAAGSAPSAAAGGRGPSAAAPGRGPSAVADSPRSTVPPLSETLEQAARLVPSGAAVVVATGLDHPGAAFAAVLGGLTRRVRVIVVLVLDALDAAAPDRPLAFFGDDGAVASGRLATPAPAERAAAMTALGATVLLVRAHADGLSLAAAA